MAFADVTGQEHVKTTIANQIANGTTAHAYLFSGPRGVGKTTIARLFAKAMNCLNRKEGESEPCNTCSACGSFNKHTLSDIVEIDAASNTQVDVMRENVIESVRFSPMSAKYKVFIIDEVHMLSNSSFNALLKTLEEPPNHAFFILATTDLHKIPDTVLSRCQQFTFHRIGKVQMKERLVTLSVAEGKKVDDPVFDAIIRLSDGCLRDAESLLNQVFALGTDEITEAVASIILPKTSLSVVVNLVSSYQKKSPTDILQALYTFIDEGGDMNYLYTELIGFVRACLFLKSKAPVSDQFVGFEAEMGKIVEAMTDNELTTLLDAILSARAKPMFDPIPQINLEVALLGSFSSSAPTTPKPIPPVAPVATPAQPSPAPAQPAPVAQPPQKPTPPPAPKNDNPQLEEIQNKWGRIMEALARVNIAIPLVVSNAKPFVLNDKEIHIGIPHQFHFDTVNDQKKLALIANAVKEVMGIERIIVPVYQKPEEEKTIDSLVEAFGGSVVD